MTNEQLAQTCRGRIRLHMKCIAHDVAFGLSPKKAWFHLKGVWREISQWREDHQARRIAEKSSSKKGSPS